MEPYSSLSNLMEIAVEHWIMHKPRMTLNLLLKKQLGEKVYEAAKTLMVLIHREKSPTNRDAMWEAMREQYILLWEEPLVEEDPEKASRIRQQIEEMIDLQYPYSKEKGRINNALQVTGWTLERKGVRVDWTPKDGEDVPNEKAVSLMNELNPTRAEMRQVQ